MLVLADIMHAQLTEISNELCRVKLSHNNQGDVSRLSAHTDRSRVDLGLNS
jgi:hypothetical protein